MKYRVCNVHEIAPGDKRSFTIKNIPIVVVHSKQGEFYALYGLCPHQRSSLAAGVLGGLTVASQPGEAFEYIREGEILRCPWHGFSYDVTTGQLQVYAGRVRSYEEGKDDVAVTFALRHTRKELVVRAGLVINCTGLNSDIRSFDHPLIVNLLEQGLTRPGVLGIGMDTTIKGTLVNAEGHSSSWLWTLGSLRRGQLWETTAVSEIRQQAEQLAMYVLQASE